MKRLIETTTPTQTGTASASSWFPALGPQQQTPSLSGLCKGDFVQGFVREIRVASVNVRLMNGVSGWAHGSGLRLEGAQRPSDRYCEGDWISAEVAGLDYGNECATLSIRSHLSHLHYYSRPSLPSVPITLRHSDSALERLQRGDRLWVLVQEVRETGLHVLAGDVPGWIDRRVANIPEREAVADRYRIGQFIPIWVTGVNYEGGEFAAQTYPLSSPQPVTSNWQETIR